MNGLSARQVLEAYGKEPDKLLDALLLEQQPDGSMVTASMDSEQLEITFVIPMWNGSPRKTGPVA